MLLLALLASFDVPITFTQGVIEVNFGVVELELNVPFQLQDLGVKQGPCISGLQSTNESMQEIFNGSHLFGGNVTQGKLTWGWKIFEEVGF